jgi:uncharacterized protein (TIGR03000 family)
MFQKVLTFCGLPTLAAAAILLTADPGEARGPGGGGHGGGGHFGGGFHAGVGGGFSRGYGGGSSRGYGGYYHGGYSRGYYPSYGNRSHYGYGHHYGYRRYGYGYPYYGSYYDSYPYYGSDLYGSSYPDYSYDLGSGAAYGSGDNGSSGDPGPSYAVTTETNGMRIDTGVNITVRLPANAELWFDGTKTKSTGTVRKFQSPPLRSGLRYTYDLRARWKDNGRTVTQTRHITVSAGDQIAVRFPVRSGTKG